MYIPYIYIYLYINTIVPCFLCTLLEGVSVRNPCLFSVIKTMCQPLLLQQLVTVSTKIQRFASPVTIKQINNTALFITKHKKLTLDLCLPPQNRPNRANPINTPYDP